MEIKNIYKKILTASIKLPTQAHAKRKLHAITSLYGTPEAAENYFYNLKYSPRTKIGRKTV
jgi:hypothetical protein